MNDSPRREGIDSTGRRYVGRCRSAGLRMLRLAVAGALASLGLMCTTSGAQSAPTADRIGDLQIGGGFVLASSNYNFTPSRLLGGAFYTTFDKRNHWGGEFDFRQSKPTQDSTVYERTYEIGPRIFVRSGRLAPYGKVLIGRGVYNFSHNVANVAYNMYTFGGGADFRALRSWNVRADYEYQTWMGFPIQNLHPSVVTIGIAFHFHE
jgi:hypothetical protein